MRTPSLATRAYIYRVLVTAAPIAATYGAMSSSEIVLWVTLAGTILGVGLAAANTPTPTRGEDGNLEPGSAAIGLVVGLLVAYLILR